MGIGNRIISLGSGASKQLQVAPAEVHPQSKPEALALVPHNGNGHSHGNGKQTSTSN